MPDHEKNAEHLNTEGIQELKLLIRDAIEGFLIIQAELWVHVTSILYNQIDPPNAQLVTSDPKKKNARLLSSTKAKWTKGVSKLRSVQDACSSPKETPSIPSFSQAEAQVPCLKDRPTDSADPRDYE